jgi:hypothetical protein
MSSNDKDENCFVYYKYASNARQCKLGILILATSTMIFVRRLIKFSLHFINFPLVDEIKTSQPPAAPTWYPTLSPSPTNGQGFESFSIKAHGIRRPQFTPINWRDKAKTHGSIQIVIACRSNILALWWAAGT